jgi:hypothetical protein
LKTAVSKRVLKIYRVVGQKRIERFFDQYRFTITVGVHHVPAVDANNVITKILDQDKGCKCNVSADEPADTADETNYFF